MKNEYRIIIHHGVLASTPIFELQIFSERLNKWVSAYASSFTSDLKHYCMDVNAMEIFNKQDDWIHQNWYQG